EDEPALVPLDGKRPNAVRAEKLLHGRRRKLDGHGRSPSLSRGSRRHFGSSPWWRKSGRFCCSERAGELLCRASENEIRCRTWRALVKHLRASYSPARSSGERSA